MKTILIIKIQKKKFKIKIILTKEKLIRKYKLKIFLLQTLNRIIIMILRSIEINQIKKKNKII